MPNDSLLFICEFFGLGGFGEWALDGRVIESTTTETVVPHRVRDLEGK